MDATAASVVILAFIQAILAAQNQYFQTETHKSQKKLLEELQKLRELVSAQGSQHITLPGGNESLSKEDMQTVLLILSRLKDAVIPGHTGPVTLDSFWEAHDAMIQALNARKIEAKRHEEVVASVRAEFDTKRKREADMHNEAIQNMQKLHDLSIQRYKNLEIDSDLKLKVYKDLVQLIPTTIDARPQADILSRLRIMQMRLEKLATPAILESHEDAKKAHDSFAAMVDRIIQHLEFSAKEAQAGKEQARQKGEQVKVLESELQRISAESNECCHKLNTLQKELDEKSAELERAKHERSKVDDYEKKVDEIKNLETQLKRLQESKEKGVQEENELRAQINNLAQEKDNLSQELNDARQENRELKDTVSTERKAVQDAKDNGAEKEKELLNEMEKLKKEQASLSNKLNDAQVQNRTLDISLKSEQKAVQDAIEKGSRLERELENQKKSLQKMNGDHSQELREVRHKHSKEKEQLETEIKSLRDAKEAAVNAKEGFKDQAEILQKEKDDLSKKLCEAQHKNSQDIQELKADLTSLAEAKTVAIQEKEKFQKQADDWKREADSVSGQLKRMESEASKYASARITQDVADVTSPSEVDQEPLRDEQPGNVHPAEETLEELKTSSKDIAGGNVFSKEPKDDRPKAAVAPTPASSNNDGAVVSTPLPASGMGASSHAPASEKLSMARSTPRVKLPKASEFQEPTVKTNSDGKGEPHKVHHAQNSAQKAPPQPNSAKGTSDRVETGEILGKQSKSEEAKENAPLEDSVESVEVSVEEPSKPEDEISASRESVQAAPTEPTSKERISDSVHNCEVPAKEAHQHQESPQQETHKARHEPATRPCHTCNEPIPSAEIASHVFLCKLTNGKMEKNSKGELECRHCGQSFPDDQTEEFSSHVLICKKTGIRDPTKCACGWIIPANCRDDEMVTKHAVNCSKLKKGVRQVQCKHCHRPFFAGRWFTKSHIPRCKVGHEDSGTTAPSSEPLVTSGLSKTAHSSVSAESETASDTRQVHNATTPHKSDQNPAPLNTEAAVETRGTGITSTPLSKPSTISDFPEAAQKSSAKKTEIAGDTRPSSQSLPQNPCPSQSTQKPSAQTENFDGGKDTSKEISLAEDARIVSNGKGSFEKAEPTTASSPKTPQGGTRVSTPKGPHRSLSSANLPESVLQDLEQAFEGREVIQTEWELAVDGASRAMKVAANQQSLTAPSRSEMTRENIPMVASQASRVDSTPPPPLPQASPTPSSSAPSQLPGMRSSAHASAQVSPASPPAVTPKPLPGLRRSMHASAQASPATPSSATPTPKALGGIRKSKHATGSKGKKSLPKPPEGQQDDVKIAPQPTPSTPKGNAFSVEKNPFATPANASTSQPNPFSSTPQANASKPQPNPFAAAPQAESSTAEKPPAAPEAKASTAEQTPVPPKKPLFSFTPEQPLWSTEKSLFGTISVPNREDSTAEKPPTIPSQRPAPQANTSTPQRPARSTPGAPRTRETAADRHKKYKGVAKRRG